MPNKSLIKELPATRLGSNRCVEVGEVGHGDFAVWSWRGDLAYERTDEMRNGGREPRKRFQFQAGSEANVVAGLISYLRRAEAPNIRKTIVRAGEVAINGSQYDSAADTSRYRIPYSIATNDEGYPQFDLAQGDLSALMVPVPIQPGERKAYTGLYADPYREPLTLKICSLFDKGRYGFYELNVKHSEEFTVDDAAVIAGMVCSVARGRSRDQVVELLRSDACNA